jgi:hypothetical protein
MFFKLKQLLDRVRRSANLRSHFFDDPELEWLNPPSDPLDVAAWDRYWNEQVSHGLGPPLSDMFCDDRRLLEVMDSRGMRSVICAGSGISQEPAALSAAGLEVVAMDFSAQAIEIAKSFELPSEGFEFYCDPASRKQGGVWNLSSATSSIRRSVPDRSTS